MNGSDWLPEFDLEFRNTRRMLERVPEDRLGFRPHPKSYSLAELATHMAWIPHWIPYTLEQPSLDLSAPDAPERPKVIGSRAELLALFDAGVKDARISLAAAPAASLQEPWSLMAGERTHFTLPRLAVLRGFIFSHSIHHRGQLDVYLRLLDVPLPAIYGPSADENPS